MQIKISESEFDPFLALSEHQKERNYTIGACACFIGTMRDFNEGRDVSSMTLEHYPGMTENQLTLIVQTRCDQHTLEDALVIHRVGEIKPGEPIVLVATWSSHRKQAFDACRGIMEDLKHKAPFWKKEQTEKGIHWVENNTPG